MSNDFGGHQLEVPVRPLYFDSRCSIGTWSRTKDLLTFLRDSLDLMGRAIKRCQLRLLFSLGGFVKCCQLLNLVSKMVILNFELVSHCPYL